MTFPLTPAKRRLFLQQAHCEEWVAFFNNQLAIRHLLSRQHQLENDGLRLLRTSNHKWAVVIQRQATDMIEFEILNQNKQAGIQTHQDQENNDLEYAIRMPDKPGCGIN